MPIHVEVGDMRLSLRFRQRKRLSRERDDDVVRARRHSHTDFQIFVDRFIRGLKEFFAQRQISADWEAIDKAADEHLITSIAMLCPFAPSEKQALLEAPDLDERARLLIALVEMAAIKPTTEPTGATRH